MRDLTAHVTSSLLQFPDVTIQALREDETTIDWVLQGKFTGGRSGLACLACGPQLEVVNTVNGERLSAYRFSGLNQQPPTILAVKEFSWQRRSGLLIGLEETEGSVLCLYDLGISRVVKAVVLPGRVTAIEPIINHGGASLTTQHLHQSLRWLFGVAAVVTDVGHVLLIDLCLDDLSCSQNEMEASDLEVITGILPEIPQIREAVTRKGRHLCFQLVSPSGTAVTTLSYIHRSNHLVVGFSDGYISLWNMKSLKKEYHSQLEGGKIPVYAVTFQEPENDPRNCCYLWAVQSTQESEGDIVSLHLLQMAFSDRRRLASGQIMYEGLEYCEERYSLDLTGGIFSLRGQTSNTKLTGCQTVEKFRTCVDREDGINEIISPETSVSVFSWQVNTYGQGKPNIYLGIFDINRWYHAQMPDSLRPGEFLHDCPYFALWSLDAVVNMTSPYRILDVLVHERSFSRGVPPSCPPPEQFFNPSTYSFDATCLLNSGVVHVTCTGFQKDTLHFLKKSASSLHEVIPDGYNRCLVAGLLSPRFIDSQPSSLSQEEQFEAVLSAAVQTSSLALLINSTKQWSAEQTDSSPNLHFVLEWTWNKVVNTKEDFVRLCIPLFDGSSNFIDPQTLQSLQRCELLLNNLSTVLNYFVMETQEPSEQGTTDLTNKQVVTSLLVQYVQVVLWFCRSNLLPESLDEDMQLSKPFYNYEHIQCFYASCRQKLERLSRGKWSPDCLMIDGLISQLGDSVVKLWQKDGGGTGKYPPPSLHALLDIYLSENIEELYKHAITIYLLLDVMHSCPNRTDNSVDSFPTAFAIPIGLVNLIQGFWCLDHSDYENSLAYLFHPAASKFPWQHIRIIQSLMCHGQHKRALRYIQTMKPSMLSSSEVALHLTVLLFNSCMVEAWSVLRQHSTRLNVVEMLRHVYETCQELGLMEDLLKLPFTETEQECLEKFLQTGAGVNHEFLLVHHLQRANYIPALQLNQSLKNNFMNDHDPRWRERSAVRNSILDQYGKVLPRVQRKLAVERAKPYHLSSSLRREILRPKPLSTVAKQVAPGNVVTKSAFIHNVLSKIGEVWEETEQKNKPFQNYTTEEQPCNAVCSDRELPNPFVGTPVTKSLRKCSRLLDLVVQPISLDSPLFQSNLQESPKATSSGLCSLLHASPQHSLRTLLQKNIKQAPELKLLETPPVVKRAKALTSTSSFGFPNFTPQSILRSSFRTTPLATPTASPVRSVTPPLRAKETKISFVEENRPSQWTAEMADHKAKHTAVSSEYNINPQMEDIWTKTRKMPSFLVCDVQEDHRETEMSSESILEKPLDTTETSKKTNNTCVDSSEINTEHHAAESPADLEKKTFVTSHSVQCVFEETVNTPESPVRETSEIVRRDLFQVEHQASGEREQSAGEQEMELPEEKNTEYGLLAVDRILAMDNLTAVQDTKVSFVPPNESNVLEASGPTLLEDSLLPEPSSQALEPVGADAESVISIPDSEEDNVSTHSKNELEERNAADANKPVDFVREETIVVLHEEAPDIQHEIQEVNLTEDGKHLEQIPDVVVERFPYSELSPSSSLKFEYNYTTVEKQVTCEFLDKEADETSFVEGDEGEILVSQNDFSLILEGDEEPEIENSTVLQTFPLKSTGPQPESVSLNATGNNNQELITNSVSTVISNQISQNTAKVLPYVPEPIQMAIAENLLDVVKDTRSKISTEVVEESLPENINNKVLSPPQTPVQNIFEMDQDMNQVERLVPSNNSTTDQTKRKPNIPLSDDQLLPKIDKPEMLLPSTPRRSARLIKETSSLSESFPAHSEDKPQHQRLQSLGSPVREGKKVDISANVYPVAKEFQTTITPRRGVKNAKKLAPEPHERSSDRRRASRITRSLIGEQEGSQFVIDHTIQMTVNPKSSRKLKTIALQLAENVISDQEEKPHNEQLTAKPRRGKPRKTAQRETDVDKLPVPIPDRRGKPRKSGLPKAILEGDIQPNVPQKHVPTRQEDAQNKSVMESVPDREIELIEQPTVQRKRGRPRKNPLDVSANVQLDFSLSSPSPQTDTRTAVTTRRNTRSKAISLSSSAGSLPLLEESAVHTTKKKSAKKDTEKPVIEEQPVQADESLTSAKRSTRRQAKMTTIRKRKQPPSLSEKGTEEEHLLQATDNAAELQSIEMTRLRLGETGETLPQHGSHVKRTRHHKKSVNENLSLDETFYFSPPLTKLTGKTKGEKPVTPVQFKGLDTDLASQFVFSPPVLRSRKKQISSISRIVEELELPLKEEKETISIEALEKPKRKRGRPAGSKMTKTSKGLGKDSSWSPPPMEIKFISPFGTPVDGSENKPRESVDKLEKTGQKTVRRKEKRLSNYPKPVVRKTML